MLLSGSFRRDVDDLQEVFALLHRFVDAQGLGEAVQLSLDLVAEELFTNLLRHNRTTSEEIEISIARTGDEIVLELVDRDVDPFDPRSAPDPKVDRPMEERRAGGLGLHLVKSLVDRLAYSYENRTMRIRATKRIA